MRSSVEGYGILDILGSDQPLHNQINDQMSQMNVPAFFAESDLCTVIMHGCRYTGE